MEASSATQKKAQAALVSVISNVSLTILKVIAAIASGSVSVLSEALHSAGDVIASLMAYGSVRVSDRPADRDHPFGHGKVESVAGLGEALLLFFAALYVGYEAIHRFTNPESIEVDFALVVIIGTAIVNIFVGKYLRRVARETDSEALRADAAHITADLLTSVGVLVALVLVRVSGNPIFDPVVALFLTAWILYTAVRIGWGSIQLLIDKSLPDEEVQLIEQILREHPSVLAWHQLRTRKSGSNRHIDAHVLLADDLTLIEAHEITESVEDKIRDSLSNVSISLHMEPYRREVRHRRDVHNDQVKQ